MNFVAAHLDAGALVNFSLCCKDVNENMKSIQTLRWLGDLRGIPHSLDNLEQLELAEAMANFKSMIFFRWSDTNLANPDYGSLGVVARALHRHSSLSLSIEAHCSLEGMLHLPTRGKNLFFLMYSMAKHICILNFKNRARGGVHFS